MEVIIRPEVFISSFTGFFLQIEGLGWGEANRKKISENDQLTGHFLTFFVISPE